MPMLAREPGCYSTAKPLRIGLVLRSRWLMLLLLCAAITACDGWVTKPTRYNVIEVTTHLQDGAPVAAVPLILYTGQRTMGYAATSSNGVYRFERVPQGIYGVFALPSPAYGLISELTGPRIDYVDGLEATADTTIRVEFVLYKR